MLHNSYYQWVPVFFILQAILFYIPRCIWLSTEGGMMAFLVSGCTGTELGYVLGWWSWSPWAYFYLYSSSNSWENKILFCLTRPFANTLDHTHMVKSYCIYVQREWWRIRQTNRVLCWGTTVNTFTTSSTSTPPASSSVSFSTSPSPSARSAHQDQQNSSDQRGISDLCNTRFSQLQLPRLWLQCLQILQVALQII